MNIAVIIPFRGDPATLAWALDGFAQQQLPPDTSLEIRLCGDGVPVPPTPTPTQPRITFTSTNSPRVGASEAKNILLHQAPADIVIFSNSDTRPDPQFVRIHAETLLQNPPDTFVLGYSPWEQPPNPTAFDALLADTPMIFFYNQLTPHHWYDFRHAWTLNLSLRYADALAAGGFEKLIRPVYYDDLVLSHRLLGSTKKGVFFQPAAKSLHRHPTTLDQYLDREELLGLMLPVLATACPDLFNALHPDRSFAQLADEARLWTTLDLPSHRWIYQRLQEWAVLPETILGIPGTPDSTRLKLTIYQMHLPLKRLAFRLGLLRGMTTRDDSLWQQRKPRNEWRTILNSQLAV